MYDVKPGQLVECEWIDPTAGCSWEEVPSVSGFWKFVCRSVGYIHMVEPDGLILVACYGEDPDGDQSLLLRQHIPWGSITEIWILREPE